MPGQPPPGGAPPSPPANVGPVTSPGGNQGNIAHATIMIGNGLQLLQQALGSIPLGSPLHSDIMQSVLKISKHMPDAGQGGGGHGGLHAQGLQQALRAQAQQAPQLAAMRQMGGGPGTPSGPPAMPAPEIMSQQE